MKRVKSVFRLLLEPLLQKKGSGLSETFSVHRIAYGEGMERLFFLHSPLTASIELIRKGIVARSKLYYLRGTRGKAAKVKSRFFTTKKDKKAAALQEEVVVEEPTPVEPTPVESASVESTNQEPAE